MTIKSSMGWKKSKDPFKGASWPGKESLEDVVKRVRREIREAKKETKRRRKK